MTMRCRGGVRPKVVKNQNKNKGGGMGGVRGVGVAGRGGVKLTSQS